MYCLLVFPVRLFVAACNPFYISRLYRVILSNKDLIYELTIINLVPMPHAPMAKSTDKWMFFSYDSMGKSTVICIHPRFFVTFRHGSHLQLKKGDALTIYNAKQGRRTSRDQRLRGKILKNFSYFVRIMILFVQFKNQNF
uniref:LTD domain-containing protein n=1 Tax=Heterorhabditis bacteriophora TaxID=37862 RepID=A0A1I7WCD9_HETBA